MKYLGAIAMSDYTERDDEQMIGEPLAKIMKLMPTQNKEECIKALILRRRVQIWVHSMIYYNLNANIVSDSVWSRWAEDLECLQTMYPELAAQVAYADVFEGFDHSTGANLPTNNTHINSKATYLLKITQDRYRR